MNARNNNANTEFGRMLGARELAQYLSMGQTRAAEFGKRCGAMRKFGRRALYDRNVIDAALDQMSETAEG